MSFYEDMRDVATDLIGDFGASLSVERDSEGAYDPATGVTSDSTTTFTSKGIVSSFSNSEIDGTNIKVGDLSVFVKSKPSGWVPEIRDKVTINGVEYFIVNVQPLSPGGTDLAYQIQIRK